MHIEHFKYIQTFKCYERTPRFGQIPGQTMEGGHIWRFGGCKNAKSSTNPNNYFWTVSFVWKIRHNNDAEVKSMVWGIDIWDYGCHMLCHIPGIYSIGIWCITDIFIISSWAVLHSIIHLHWADTVNMLKCVVTPRPSSSYPIRQY